VNQTSQIDIFTSQLYGSGCDVVQLDSLAISSEMLVATGGFAIPLPPE